MQRFLAIFIILLVTGTALAATSVSQLQQLIAQQKFAAAASAGEQLLKQDPQHSQLRFLTAYAQQMNANSARAVTLYQDLIRDQPGSPEPRNNLAMIFLAQGDYDRASQLLVEAINTHNSYATAYANLSQVYKGIASEAYRRAVSESSEPAKYTHNIELTALTQLAQPGEMVATDPGAQTLVAAAKQEPVTSPAVEESVIHAANQETLLIEQVKRWAVAWSDKNLASYIDFYRSEYRAKFDSHEQWLAERRKRITRPGDIRVKVSNIQIKWRSENRAIIDFTQAFDSPRYSDRVVKRLGFDLIGSEWKIAEERVLSVL